MSQPQGELVPVGGGDPVPLVRTPMVVGRRDSCDVCLRYPNISGQHTELSFIDGYWLVTDMGSTNGTKVNGVRVQKKLVRPGDEISFANRRFQIKYHLTSDAGKHVVIEEDVGSDVLNTPLLERAGLTRRQREDDDDDTDEKPRQPRRHRPGESL